MAIIVTQPNEYIAQRADLGRVASAIRQKAGIIDKSLVFPGQFVSSIEELPEPKEEQEKSVSIIQNGVTEILPDDGKALSKVTVTAAVSGGTTPSVEPSDINFIDYDGTVVAAWSLDELSSETALPTYPSHEGLTCQGWNWTLAQIKAAAHKLVVGAMYATSDGKTRIYIHLEEGRTSPMLGCCPAGTVVVDWGDGTATNSLTGTSKTAVKWTPTHNYAAPGDYVITLSMTSGTLGLMGNASTNAYSYLLRQSTGGDSRNLAYTTAIRRVELGANVTVIGSHAFNACYRLTSVTTHNALTNVEGSAFYNARSLRAFVVPTSVNNLNDYLFCLCTSLAAVSLPKKTMNVNSALFNSCFLLSELTIPDAAKSIGTSAFTNCYGLAKVVMYGDITSIAANAFNGCSGVRIYDFSRNTAVPTLANTNAFNNIASDCEILVPASLLDTWKAATNWATYASRIKSAG